jgi:hypothetical protein
MLSHRTGVTRHGFHLVQIHFYAARAVGPSALPRTHRANADEVPVQQPDVHGGWSGH